MAATMVAGIALGPWAAFAMSTAFTSMELAQGKMSLEQALVETGKAAAVAVVSSAASELADAAASKVSGDLVKAVVKGAVQSSVTTIGSKAVSGVNYNPVTGKMSYDADVWTDKKAWLMSGATVLGSAVSAGIIEKFEMKADGFSAAATRGAVDTSTKMAYTPKEDWAGLWQTSMINIAGNYLGGRLAGGFEQGAGVDNEYTKSLIGNFTSFLGRKMLGSGEDFDLNTLTHVDTMQLIANDVIGGYFKNKQLEDKKDAMKEQGMSPEEINLALKREEAQANRDAAERAKNDPLAGIDDALGGLFVSFGRGLGQTTSQIASAIKDGAQSAIQFASTTFERTGNLFAGDGFKTDGEIEAVQWAFMTAGVLSQIIFPT